MMGASMPNVAANHFAFSGSAVEGVVDLSDISGQVVASVTVDGVQLPTPVVDVTTQGIVVQAIVREVPDDFTLTVAVTVPAVNLTPGSTASICAGFAVLVTVRTSFGGPALVSGPLQLFEFRPVAVTASVIETVRS
jgi:hypothetical protein